MQATFTLIAEQGILQRSADNYPLVIYLITVDFHLSLNFSHLTLNFGCRWFDSIPPRAKLLIFTEVSDLKNIRCSK